jgi:hypothetical protein
MQYKHKIKQTKYLIIVTYRNGYVIRINSHFRGMILCGANDLLTTE